MAVADPLGEAARSRDPRAAIVSLLTAQWDAGRYKARTRLEAGAPGVEVARLYAAAADEVIRTLWRFTDEHLHPAPNPTEAERLSVLAVGGYGRGVLAPFSDLDLLFLRPWKTTARSETLAEFMLYVLWDLGAKVGSAVRSIDQSLNLARADMTVRTALLEARVVAGDPSLGDEFLARFRHEVEKSDPRPFIAAKLAERDLRHQKAGAVRYRVEPNVKDGKGGLRDLNALFWIARALAPHSPLGEDALKDVLTGRERRMFADAFHFLWSVRCHIHLTSGRAEEKLTFDLQPEVARRMGWRGRGDEPAVERFMRRYFIVARDVGALTRAVSAQLEARGQKQAGGLSRLDLTRLIPRRRKRLRDSAFIVEGGRLTVAGPEVFAEKPARLVQLFASADAQDLDLHPDAFSAVSRSLSLVTPALRRDVEAGEAFLKVLAHGQRPYRVLSIMNETGLLGRFLPEWGRIVGQTQFNMYHAYTVDEHTLQAIGVINDIARGKLQDDHPLASVIVHRIADPEVLMLGMLLHDVGKGGDRGQLEDGEIAARRACERLGLDRRRAELVAWLVRHHLALSDTAQKRDVSDPATVRGFAELVGDPERLRMLLVLTVADVRAVGPTVWNGWKGQLMRQLYAATEALFRGEDTPSDDPDLEQLALIGRAASSGGAVLARPGEADATEVAIAARDRPGLFAEIAEVMASAGADVVGARLRTAPDGAVLDRLLIQDGAGAPYGQSDPRRLKALVSDLERVARGEPAPRRRGDPTPSARRAAFDVRPVVMIDNQTSEAATVVEVSGADRPRLLADLARAIADQGLSIRSAHVASFGERAVDSFYVVAGDGRRLTSKARIKVLTEALTAVIERAPEPQSSRPRARASMRDVSEFGPRPAAKSVSRRRAPV